MQQASYNGRCCMKQTKTTSTEYERSLSSTMHGDY